MNADPAFLFYLLLFLNSSLYSLWTKLQEFHNNFFFYRWRVTRRADAVRQSMRSCVWRALTRTPACLLLSTRMTRFAWTTRSPLTRGPPPSPPPAAGSGRARLRGDFPPSLLTLSPLAIPRRRLRPPHRRLR